MRLSSKEIVCISTSDWDFPYGSKQHIMSCLAGTNRILFIEAQISILHILKNPFQGIKKIKRWLGGIQRKKDSLYIYTPVPLLPFGNYFIFINNVNQFILLYSLKRQMKRIGFKRPILWIYFPNSVLLIGKMREMLSIYYCIDDFPSEINSERRRRTMEFLENSILQRADIVFVCSKGLYERRVKVREDMNFLLNGVDFDSFNRKEREAVPTEISNIGRPRIGFLGTLDSRLDIGLISFIASEKPNWQIILIGKVLLLRKDRYTLNAHPNIHMLGFRKHQLVPRYIQMMDVCIIPYKTRGFNRSVFPIKTFEYLAAGKPVVSTFLPELYDFRETIKLSGNQTDFIRNIEFYLKDSSGTSQRRKVASEHSWSNKIDILSELIYSRIKNNRGALVL